MTAIFCRTGSAIQSAVARWNLISALEFTGERERREHGSLRLQVGSAPRWLPTIQKQREARNPTRCVSFLCQLGDTKLAVE